MRKGKNYLLGGSVFPLTRSPFVDLRGGKYRLGPDTGKPDHYVGAGAYGFGHIGQSDH